MSVGYECGKIVGNFEVVEKLGCHIESNGSRQGVYRARCGRCGELAVLLGRQLRGKKDCGCRRQGKAEAATAPRYRQKSSRTHQPWMEEGEIYRSWKESKNRSEQYSVLAQLNDVPIAVIHEIIKKRKEADDQFETATSTAS